MGVKDDPITPGAKTEAMERDILQAVYELGEIRNLAAGDTPAVQRLNKKYDSDTERKQLSIVLNHLVRNHFLFHLGHFEGTTIDGTTGITPKGVRRLKRLRAPRKAWAKRNVFPLLIAAITALVGLLGPVITAKCV